MSKILIDSNPCKLMSLSSLITENLKLGDVKGFSGGVYSRLIDSVFNDGLCVTGCLRSLQWTTYSSLPVFNQLNSLPGSHFSLRQPQDFRLQIPLA